MGKKGKIHSLSKRIARWIAVTQFVVMGLASWGIYWMAKNFIIWEETDLYKSYLITTKVKVSKILNEVKAGAVNHVSEIEANLARPDKMGEIMQRIVAQNPYIRSCGLSFTTDYYPQKGHRFCPYAFRDSTGQVRELVLGNGKDDYLKAEWFLEALKADSSYWSKPFFEHNDTLNPLVSYIMPIHNAAGATVGVLGVDLSLDWFSRQLETRFEFIRDGSSTTINVGSDDDKGKDTDKSYSGLNDVWRIVRTTFIIDGEGTFIAHPDSSLVLRQNYFELAETTKDTLDNNVGRQMVAGLEGVYSDQSGKPQSIEMLDPNDLDSYVFYAPVEGTDWSVAMVVPWLMIDAIGMGMGIAMLLLIGLAMIVVRFVGMLIIRRTIKPLRKLADSANEVAKGNFSTPLPKIKHNDEVRLLRDSFEGMQHSLSEYVEELKETTASKAAIENELKVAHDIQMAMLPKTFPPFPERDDIDIYGMLMPAKDVGGDLFDFYIHDEKLFFCIGDVSGKGIPASLVMAMTRSLFRNISSHTVEPHLIAQTLNDALAEGNENSMFVTAFIGVLELGSGLLHYCNAGHNPPLLIGREVSLVPCEPNVPLGLMAGMDFVPQEIQFEHQMTIFLFTDGLNEAEDHSLAQFGDDRVLQQAEALLANGKNQPTEIVNQMNEAVHAFVNGAQQSDDLTMLAIKYN